MSIKTVDAKRVMRFVSVLDDSIDHDASDLDSYKKEYTEDAAKKHLVFKGELFPPTWFNRRVLTSSMRAAIEGECKSEIVDGDQREMRFNTSKLALLAFRAGVCGIDDPDITFKEVNEKGLRMVEAKLVDSLPPLVVQEIGLLVWVKDSGVTEEEKGLGS